MKATRPVIYLVLTATVIVLVLALSYYVGLTSTPSSLERNNETSRGWTTLNLSNDTVQSNSPSMTASSSSVYVAWQACSDSCDIYFRASSDGGRNFGSVINLSRSTGHSTQPQVAASGNNVYAMWRDNTPGEYQIFFRASKNRGATFEPVIVLSGSGTGAANNHQIIAASNGGVYVSWYSNPVKSRLLFRASRDNGTSFGSSIDLNREIEDDLRIEYGWRPQITAHGSNVYFAWYSDYEILLKVSRDYGASFGDVVQLTKSAFTGWRSMAPRMVADESDLYLTYILRTVRNNGEMDRVFFMASNDEGRTFGGPIELQRSANNIIPAGNDVYLISTEIVDNKSTLFLQRSSDRGKTFINETTKILVDGKVISLRAVSSGNHLYLEWVQRVPDPRDGQMFFIGPSQLFLIESADNGASFGQIIALTDDLQTISSYNILASDSRLYMVWEEGAPFSGKRAVNTEVIFIAK